MGNNIVDNIRKGDDCINKGVKGHAPTYFGGGVKKKPLLPEEEKILIEIARIYKTYRNCDMHKTVLVFLDTGVHRIVLSKPSKYELHTRIYNLPKKKGLYVEWYRPKKKRVEGYTSIKASKRIKDWVGVFIKELKPRYREFYNEMCIHLQKLIVSEYPNIDFYGGDQLSPATFRHTCCCNLLLKGMPDSMVALILNVDKKTLRFYANFVGGMVDDFYNKIDW